MKKLPFIFLLAAVTAHGQSLQDRVATLEGDAIVQDAKLTAIEAEQNTQNGRLDTLEAAGGAPSNIPVGGIIMWEGTVAPPGWCILDGSDGRCPRPNLTGRFIKAAGTGLGDAPGGPLPPITPANPRAPVSVPTDLEPKHVHELYGDINTTGGPNGKKYVKDDSVKDHGGPLHRDIPEGEHSHTIEIKDFPHYSLIFIKKL